MSDKNYTLLPSKPGAKGDVRMSRAVALKLANPDLSLFEALVLGGFRYRVDDNNSFDEVDDNDKNDSSKKDRVKLGQRKNNLCRRLRRAKLGQEKRQNDVGFGGHKQEYHDVPPPASPEGGKKRRSSSSLTLPSPQDDYKMNHWPMKEGEEQGRGPLSRSVPHSSSTSSYEAAARSRSCEDEPLMSLGSPRMRCWKSTNRSPFPREEIAQESPISSSFRSSSQIKQEGSRGGTPHEESRIPSGFSPLLLQEGGEAENGEELMLAATAGRKTSFILGGDTPVAAENFVVEAAGTATTRTAAARSGSTAPSCATILQQGPPDHHYSFSCPQKQERGGVSSLNKWSSPDPPADTRGAAEVDSLAALLASRQESTSSSMVFDSHQGSQEEEESQSEILIQGRAKDSSFEKFAAGFAAAAADTASTTMITYHSISSQTEAFHPIREPLVLLGEEGDEEGNKKAPPCTPPPSGGLQQQQDEFAWWTGSGSSTPPRSPRLYADTKPQPQLFFPGRGDEEESISRRIIGHPTSIAAPVIPHGGVALPSSTELLELTRIFSSSSSPPATYIIGQQERSLSTTATRSSTGPDVMVQRQQAEQPQQAFSSTDDDDRKSGQDQDQDQQEDSRSTPWASPIRWWEKEE